MRILLQAVMFGSPEGVEPSLIGHDSDFDVAPNTLGFGFLPGSFSDRRTLEYSKLHGPILAVGLASRVSAPLAFSASGESPGSVRTGRVIPQFGHPSRHPSGDAETEDSAGHYGEGRAREGSQET